MMRIGAILVAECGEQGEVRRERSSRQTELEQERSSRVIRHRLGNSRRVALRHRLQVRDSR